MDIKGRKVDLPSGAAFYVVPARYAEAEEMLGAMLESTSGLPMKFDEEGYTELFSKIAIGKLFSFPRLRSALWTCLAHCLYVPAGKQVPVAVTPSLFDDQGNREDIPQILYECAKDNAWPFMKGLWNVSKALESQISATQKPSERPPEARS